jgi:hypothetical protein
MKSSLVSHMAVYGAACLLASSFLVGCGRGEVSLPAVELTVPEGVAKTIPAEARRAAEAALNDRFAVDGESWYTARLTSCPDGAEALAQAMRLMAKGDFSEEHLEDVSRVILALSLTEMRKVRTDVRVHELSEADKLNGISWRGTFDLYGGVSKFRALDLATTLKDGAGREVTLPWLTEPRTVAIPASTNSTQSTTIEAAGLVGTLFNGDLMKEGWTGSGWSDWEDTSDTIVVRVDVTIRNGGAHTATWPDAPAARGIRKFIAPRGGLFGMAGMDETEVTLCHPDLKSLKGEDLL